MKALKIFAMVVAVLIVIVVALPFFIDVNVFRPQIESQLTAALGRQVGIGNLKLSIFSGSVSADNVSIADDPSFGHDPFIRARGLNVGVEVMPLILSKSLHVTELTLDQPQVSLVKSESGRWNFSSLGGKADSPSTPGAATGGPAPRERTASESPAQVSNPDLSVAKLTVKDGSVTIRDAVSQKRPRIYQNVNISVKEFSFISQFSFTLAADLPGGGNAKIEGKAGPINPGDASLTPLTASVTVKKLDLDASGFVDPASGIGGIADFNGTLDFNGEQARTSGTAQVEKLTASPKGTPAPHPVTIKYATVYEPQKETGQLTQADVTIGKAVARLAGRYQMEQASTVLNMKLNADNMPVDDLESMLPALGVILPSGSSLKGGTLTTDLTISGPVDKLVITGPVRLANSKLSGFDLGSKLSAISKLTGGKTGSDTSIQNFSTDVHVAPEGINTQNVNLTVPALGIITGSGTISPQNVLNYSMNANLSGGVVGGLTQLAGLGKQGAGLPFFIQGTTSDPKFVPNVKGMLSGMGGSQGQNPANSIVNGLTGLFGKKKK